MIDPTAFQKLLVRDSVSPVSLAIIFQPLASQTVIHSCGKLWKIILDQRDSISSCFTELLMIYFIITYCLTLPCNEHKRRGPRSTVEKWNKWQPLSSEQGVQNAADS